MGVYSHENDGIKCYTKMVEEHHDGATVSKAGLVIDAVRPYIGVSPDWVSFGTEKEFVIERIQADPAFSTLTFQQLSTFLFMGCSQKVLGGTTQESLLQTAVA